uniref:Transposon protein, putative, CACTA, En/Spm sub-class n=1 Tax=Oryza sativa subsp. japonica TaxID=39947 RepID=Q339L5_ORYSJ|nr:transposon protein, putative, CACTA, En/Spm sub-class [Oryza sativa Japonica Group]
MKQSPRQPGNDIDVFLEPVIDDLEILWKEGVETWDAYGQENFTLRILLFCTINDYPALGNLSGQIVKGKKACSDCMEHTRSRWLKKSRKMVYMGHRRWLPLRHTFRRKKKIFNGKKELGYAPADLSGDQVHNMVKDITNEFGKKIKHSKEDKKRMWKKKSIFWRLPYWKDLEEMNIRSELQPITDEKTGRVYLPLACQTLSKDEKIAMLSCLADIKIPSGYCARITFMREMWPFERYMGILKSYVWNRAKPERSIIEGYTTEEAIEFCIDYMAETDPIRVPVSRHEGRLAGVSTTARKRIVPNQASYAQAHFAVLQHMAEVTPYFEEHLAKVRRDNIGRSDIWINREHGARFNEWFKDRVARSTDGPSEILQRLARGLAWDVDTWQGWVNIRTGVKVDKEGFTLVDLAKVGYADEPFVLAKQVEQIFYIKDPANKKMHIIRNGKRRIVGVDNVVDEEEYNKWLAFVQTIRKAYHCK